MENSHEKPSKCITLSAAEKAAVKLSLIKRDTAKKFVAAKTWPSNEKKARAIVGAKKAPTTAKKERKKSAKDLAESLGGNYDNLKIVNNFCLKAAYDQAAKIPLKKIDNKSIVNPQIAALDGISAAWINWTTGKMPDSLATAADIKTVRAFFRSACRYESMHHFRDVANNGQCKSALPDTYTKKARGMKAAYIRQVFDEELKGSEKSLAISYFINGQTAVEIAKDLGVTRQAINKRLKRLSNNLVSNQALTDRLSQFLDESIAQTFSLSENKIIDIIDRFDRRNNVNYIDKLEVIEDVKASMIRRKRRALYGVAC